MSEEPVFSFNMAQLTALLKRQAERKPSASYFNVDILKVRNSRVTPRYVLVKLSIACTAKTTVP